MKKQLTDAIKLVFLLSVSFTFISCKKDNAANPDHVTAIITINGIVYPITNSSINKATVPLIDTKYISINGWASLTSSISLTLPDPVYQGTFNISYPGNNSGRYYDSETRTSYNDGIGTVTIEHITATYIKGTFQFNCYRNTPQEAQITNGSFEGDL